MVWRCPVRRSPSTCRSLVMLASSGASASGGRAVSPCSPRPLPAPETTSRGSPPNGTQQSPGCARWWRNDLRPVHCLGRSTRPGLGAGPTRIARPSHPMCSSLRRRGTRFGWSQLGRRGWRWRLRAWPSQSWTPGCPCPWERGRGVGGRSGARRGAGCAVEAGGGGERRRGSESSTAIGNDPTARVLQRFLGKRIEALGLRRVLRGAL